MPNISETRCTCSACNHVWHYGKVDETQAKAAAMQNLGKSMMCCGGCAPAVLIPDQKVIDLNRCPNCGSRAISKKQVTHRAPGPGDLGSRG